jgi:hypothetical protein
MIISNRHPADELADTRAQLRGLKEREAALRAELLERRGVRTFLVRCSPPSSAYKYARPLT